MAVTFVAMSSAQQSIASATQLTISNLAVPTGTVVGDRIFIFAAYKGGSAFPPPGWKNVYTYVYPGLNTQPAGSGPRMMSVWYKNYTGAPIGNITIGADLNGQTAAVVSAVTVRKGAAEEWAEPACTRGDDNTAATPHSAVGGILPMRAGSLVMLQDIFSNALTMTAPTLTATGLTSGTLTVRGSVWETGGDDAGHIIWTASPTVGTTAAPTHTGTIDVARVGHTIFVDQDIVDQIDKPITERVPTYEAKFDPRTGTTGSWMGSDMARDIELDNTQRLWIFADTFWRTATSGVPADRAGYQFTHSSLALQNGLDLATAAVTFHRAPGGGDWFPASGGYYFWPQDGIVIGNDLYVLAQRVLASNPLGAEYGWGVFKIPNAKITPITSWPVATLLYQSADSAIRPIWSPYDGGDGFIYSFAIARAATGSIPPGWRWARWSTADFTGTTQGNVTYWTGTVWSTDPNLGISLAENPHTSEGSMHKRPSDGRWIVTESVSPGPDADLGVRVGAALNGATYVPANGTSTGFWPAPTQVIKQTGDYVLDTTSSNAVARVMHVNANGDRVIRYLTTPNPTYAVKTNAQLNAYPRSERYVYEDPRFVSATNTDTDLSLYAMKAHPLMDDPAGLILTYVDNTDSVDIVTAAGLAVYWPKFVRVKKPVISNFVFNTGTGVATWQVVGAPDRQLYRTTPTGTYIELDPTLRTVTVAAGSYFEILARGVGGDTIARTVVNYSLTVGSTAAALDTGVRLARLEDGYADVAAATDTINDALTMVRTGASTAGLVDALTMARSELLADIAAATDNVTLAEDVNQAVGDLANAVDSILSDLQKGQDVADVAAALDGLVLAREEFLSDIAAAGDAASTAVARPRPLGDVAAAIDGVAAVLARSLADFPNSYAGIVDGISTSLNLAALAGDTAAILDSATVSLDDVLTASDAAATDDAATSTQGRVLAPSDAALADDVASARTDHAEPATDDAIADDAVSASLAVSRGPADVAGATDASSRLLAASRTPGDVAAAVDARTVVVDATRGLADAAAGGDAAVTVLAIERVLGSIAAAVDNVLASLVQAGSAALSDSGSATDTIDVDMIASRGLADLAPALDTIDAGLGFNRPAADLAAAVDGVARATTMARLLADLAAATDAIVLAKDIRARNGGLFDSAAASDGVTAAMSRVQYISDPVPAGDSVAMNQEFIRIAASFGEVIDDTSTHAEILREAASTIALQDFFSELLAADPLALLEQIVIPIAGAFTHDGGVDGTSWETSAIVVAVFVLDGQGTAEFASDGLTTGIFDVDGLSRSAAFDHDGVTDTAFESDGVGVGSFA